MTAKVQLSSAQARRILLHAQGLTTRQRSLKKVINLLGYVQIDTIAVVERAHHHVLWSRNSNYRPAQLDQLIASRQAFEYWAHAAAVLPMTDYRFSLPMKKRMAERYRALSSDERKRMQRVLARIRQEGPLGAKNFAHNRQQPGGWWNWKPDKLALERLFISGQLETSARQGFQKIYDLPERVIPTNINKTLPSPKEYARHLVMRTLQNHGLATARQCAYLQPLSLRQQVSLALQEGQTTGAITCVEIEGSKEPYYLATDMAEKIVEKPLSTPQLFHILSPFDNLVIQRRKLKELFKFDYQIECYVPKSKRKYGYFCLPLLFGDRFVGRMDAKADRTTRTLIVHAVHTESGKKLWREDWHEEFMIKLQEFVAFNGCDRIDGLK